MFDRQILEHFDWWLFLGLLLLMAIGFTNLNSASEAAGYTYQWKQLQWYFAGCILMLPFIFIDYRILAVYSLRIYILMAVLLIMVLFIGKTVGGSQRWIPLGIMNLQPSEPAKLMMVIVLSSYFYHDDRSSYGIFDLWRPFFLTAIPVFLIYRQPDLGTALLLLAIFGSIVFLANLRWTSFLILLGAAAAFIPLGWKFLKPYQQRRIEIFLNPEKDPFGGGYHVLQSKIAVGSGQLYGKGYLAGTQSHLNFLPEVHTDFAFSIWAEEWGLIGALALLAIYFLVISRGLAIASQSRERFGAFLAFGVTAMLFWQAIVNIGMVIGLMPVVGIPLPLISYGGSSVVTTLLGIGLLLNIRARRFMFQK
ncbi:MAG TPA: rod shape-determining protein RodA [Thermodesulfobacteriaceae bacterium]|nr:rod shape-determining protein RodA [Thermodesulfobacteriaceae bacterium]